MAGLGIGAAQGVFWAIPGTVRLGGDRVPVGAIALISMFGTTGAIIGPWLTGALVESSGDFALAIGLLASLLVLVLVLVLVLALPVIAVDRNGRAKVRPFAQP